MAERDENRAYAAAIAREDLKSLMGKPEGRRFVWGLIHATGVLQSSIANNTATTQAGLVALRDFGMQHLLQPLLQECPDLFMKMKGENDGSTADG